MLAVGWVAARISLLSGVGVGVVICVEMVPWDNASQHLKRYLDRFGHFFRMAQSHHQHHSSSDHNET